MIISDRYSFIYNDMNDVLRKGCTREGSGWVGNENRLLSWVRDWVLGIGTGNPGVFQGYPYPNPSLPVPVAGGTGFDGWGCGLPVITVAVWILSKNG